MPVIVMTGEDTFKFINDGRPQQGSENYTYYASKEQAPADIKAVMDKPLDPNRDYREQAPAAASTTPAPAAPATSNIAPRSGPPAVPRTAAPRQGVGQMIGGPQGRFDPQTGTIKPSTANIAPRAGVPAVPNAGRAAPAPTGASGYSGYGSPPTGRYNAPSVPQQFGMAGNAIGQGLGQFAGGAAAGIAEIPGRASSMLGLSPGGGTGVMPQPWLTQGATPEPAPADLWRRMGGGAVGGPGGGGPSPASPQPTYDQSYVAPPQGVGQYSRPAGYGTASPDGLYGPSSGPLGGGTQQFDTARLNMPREGESIPGFMQSPQYPGGLPGGGGSSGFGAAPPLPSYSGYGMPPQSPLGIQNVQIPQAAGGATPPMAQVIPIGGQALQLNVPGYQPGPSSLGTSVPFNPNWRR